ncbi:MAG: CBS domain-containing protein [Caldilineaceae bacterium]|nr:CBS domain-containing protein [Caldilineaceae bacterium]MCB0096072.1 CBS domain-containing protein [Caldilineaceae bacterium]
MLVKEYMTSPAATISSKIGIQAGLKMMKEGKFRRLPVVDDRGKLVGIVSERDLLHASPSQATSLSIWELNYLLSKVQIAEIMTKNVMVARPEASLESAASVMLDNKIGGLPVVDADNKVIGIITESDIFKAFLGRHKTRSDMDVFMVKQ